MKTRFLLSLAALGCCVATLRAKTLEVRIVNLRSDKGAVLVTAMKGAPKEYMKGGGLPLTARAVPEQGCVSFSFDAIEADSLTLSILHDENGNYRLDREEGRPAEGCLHLTIALSDAQNTAELELRYDFDRPDSEKTK